ncbi:hypothetical protein CAEBREN_00352 [Caenorhabditis brenneri]|uniref:Uncharacterized protein n=1 Tax=Caenorhabditis brenneri TaxID=135651 RepID=G0P349_CAEBE|nr:hypothetical protein CAEBREN_00352 [Caenorhabditis brenneri]
MKCFILLVLLIEIVAAMRYQSIAVKGKLLCGTKPANQVQVKLWENSIGPFPDDLLDQGYTDANGEFNLKGGTAKLAPVEFVFKVYNACDGSRLKPEIRNNRFILPKSYVTKEKFPKKTFDTGALNLDTILAKGDITMKTVLEDAPNVVMALSPTGPREGPRSSDTANNNSYSKESFIIIILFVIPIRYIILNL